MIHFLALGITISRRFGILRGFKYTSQVHINILNVMFFYPMLFISHLRMIKLYLLLGVRCYNPRMYVSTNMTEAGLCHPDVD